MFGRCLKVGLVRIVALDGARGRNDASLLLGVMRGILARLLQDLALLGGGPLVPEVHECPVFRKVIQVRIRFYSNSVIVVFAVTSENGDENSCTIPDATHIF